VERAASATPIGADTAPRLTGRATNQPPVGHKPATSGPQVIHKPATSRPQVSHRSATSQPQARHKPASSRPQFNSRQCPLSLRLLRVIPQQQKWRTTSGAARQQTTQTQRHKHKHRRKKHSLGRSDRASGRSGAHTELPAVYGEEQKVWSGSAAREHER